MGEGTAPTPVRQLSCTPIVRLAQVNKWYGQYHALRDIDLTVTRGECVALWGPSGSGKTTLLRCLAGIEAVQQGSIEINGTSGLVGPGIEPSPAPGVGMVFQQSALFSNLSVIDNLTIGLRFVTKLSRREAVARAMAQLEKVRMSELSFRYPAQLSGGQQQRVEIARAMCTDPDLLLFDEPTAALDPELKQEVSELIASLVGKGRSIVVATHEPALLHVLAPRMILLEEGAVVGETSPAEYFARSTP